MNRSPRILRRFGVGFPVPDSLAHVDAKGDNIRNPPATDRAVVIRLLALSLLFWLGVMGGLLLASHR